ncbi:MAG: DUF5691 domain-containing protein [Kiloniellales bacterium]|nr:DUF5691 domain-containing protein [Kiloniellales bacterium]
MSEVFTAEDLESLKRACILGLSRHPLPKRKATRALTAEGGEAEPLALLALMAQYARFLPPTQRPLEHRESRQLPIDDPRPTLPEAARAALGRLLLNRQQGQDDLILRAVFDRLRDTGYRLHPFDLPRLAGTLRRHEDRLGPAERAYLRLLRTDQVGPEEPLLDRPIDAETWTDFPRAARLRFLRDLRSTAPETARGLIESCFAGEAASLRADLVETLQIGLSDADRPFLESLNKDRARTVKERAQDLLAHIRGTTAYEERLSQVLELFAVKKGLLKRRETLTVKLPVTKRGIDQGGALRASFSGIWLSDLCRGLELSFEQLLELLAKTQEPLAYALLSCALAEGDLDALSQLAAAIPDLELQLALEALDETLWRRAKAEQAEVIRLLFARARWDGLPPAGVWEAVQAALDDALPRDIADELIASPAWRQHLGHLQKQPDGGLGDPLLAAIVPLLPPALGPRLLADLDGLTLPRHDPAAAYAAFLAALDAAGPAESREQPLDFKKPGV